jgi:two-component system, OmpR family, KDP operon response regulator KdpE
MAMLDGVPLRLTGKEFDLLAFLARHPDKVCTHQMILREVWGATYSSESQYLRVYAHRLRRKLGVHAEMLVTHAGIGYELTTSPAAAGSHRS